MLNYCQRGLFFKLSALVTAVLLATVTFVGCGSNQSNKAITEPVKIGLLVPYTGVFASCGENITRGAELYLDQVGWKVAGREIKLVKEDTEMNGQVGLQKARRLVESEKVDMLTGIVSSTVAYALRDYVVSNKIPLIIANAGATDLTREKRSPYIFRVSFANGQYEYPEGIYAFNNLHFKKIVVLAPDYAAGHEKATGFMAGFKAAGGEIVQEIYPKLGTSDYGPFFTQIKKADAVWVHFSGNDSITFVKQYDEYGLKEKMPLLTSGDCVDESSLPAQGDSALGITSALHYSAALDSVQNKNFVSSYVRKYGEEPNMFAEQGYVAAKVIVESLKAVNADLTNTDKLLSEIRKVQFEAPRGPFKFDPQTQNVIFNTYIRRVEKKDGKLVNSVIDTIPDIKDQWNPSR